MWARVCIVCAVAAILAAAPSMFTEHAGSTATQNDGSQWVKDKYERLSSLVPLTNWFRFGDPEASATMHAALWNGSGWDLQLSNRMVKAAAPTSHHPLVTATLTLPLPQPYPYPGCECNAGHPPRPRREAARRNALDERQHEQC